MISPQGLQFYAPKLPTPALVNSQWRAQEFQLLQVQQRQYLVELVIYQFSTHTQI